jgi:hypothetical protein
MAPFAKNFVAVEGVFVVIRITNEKGDAEVACRTGPSHRNTARIVLPASPLTGYFMLATHPLDE